MSGQAGRSTGKQPGDDNGAHRETAGERGVPLRIEHVDVFRRRGTYAPFPVVELLSDGRLALAFPSNDGPYQDHGFAWDWNVLTSADGGSTWAPNVRVSDRSIYRRVGITFNNQDVVGPVGMASTDEGAVITWSDSRGSAPFDAEDAYVTRVRFDDGILARAGAEDDDESPVVWVAMGAGIALGVGGAVFAVASRALRRPRSAVPA